MLIRSISGVRGITKTHLSPDVVRQYARALHQFLPEGVIMAGRDSRETGDILLEAMMSELSTLGRNVIHLGIVPTPTVQFMVDTTEAIGGIVVTASHNPAEWNGIKFIRGDSIFFHPKDCEILFEYADNDTPLKPAVERGMVFPDINAIQKQIIKTSELSCINLNRIQRRSFKVVIDAVNGAGSHALPEMLESLGCEVVRIHCDPNGLFPRGTEPLPHNLSDLSEAVLKHKADVGFAIDPDADRLAIVSEKGHPLGEEYTLVLASEGFLKETNEQNTFVVNLSSSLALEKLAEKFGCIVMRSAVGEVNVVNKMQEFDSKMGGEGNGGVILKEAHYGRDAMVGVTLVLNRLSQSSEPISSIFKNLPQFEMVKDKLELKNIDGDAALTLAETFFENASVDKTDGVKFSWNNQWIHLRKSNTEPILRIYAEAPSMEEAIVLVNKIKTEIN
ncbi:MAG: phosphoglucosamine mutase [Candidatus Marinimicrobia bacterium]|nr:phosphoglucosamine mutase [Candidatus Neomarinimicrobiota bacterium]